MQSNRSGFSLNLWRIWAQEKGNVAILFGLLLLPLIGMMGLAVDTARAYSVKLRLQESLDSAAIVGAKNFSLPTAERNQMIRDYFFANWRGGFMDSADPVLTMDPPDIMERSITIHAQVEMPTIFMRMFNNPTVTVGTLASSVSGMTYLEVALALDNTASMRILNGGVRRIDAMKASAANFINILFTENGTIQNTVENMWVSVVPFTNMVNVGSQHTNMLQAGSTNNLLWDYPRNTTTQNSWRGCVFERSFYAEPSRPYAGRDMTDASPAVEPFFPYNIPRMQVEAMTWCDDAPVAPPPPAPPAPPAPPEPPSPPYVPPPPAPCVVDGVVVPCKIMNNPVKLPEMQNPNIIQVQASPSCRYGEDDDPYVAGGTNMRPMYTLTTPRGLVIQYNSVNGVLPSKGFNRNVATLNNNSAVAANNANGLSACCGGGYDRMQNLYSTNAGRWIRPWPNATAPLLGGWGNSGCGQPLRPLTASRQLALDTINAMDVPPANLPLQTYEGTLINQGLVWGWRTISENFRGYWRESNGTGIDSTLPLDHDTNGSAKAVVVMTDGLNFLPDPWATASNWGNYYFVKNSFNTSSGNDGSFAPNFSIDGNASASVDSSAYSIMRPGWDLDVNPNVGVGQWTNTMSYCRQRQAAGLEPHLAIWGCRQFDCMMRNQAGQCIRSANDPGTGPYDVQSALTGPYYNELTRRLLVTCQNMRAQNIRIFFILFDIDGNPQKDAALAAFNTCVGTDGEVYDASNAAELSSAFQAIANRLRELRLRR